VSIKKKAIARMRRRKTKCDEGMACASNLASF
jgi:hypothetical protein